jgi:hypothetical protein
MMLLRVLRVEALKLKRTIALKMVLIAPAVVSLLILFVASQTPFSTVRRGDPWMALLRSNLIVWAALMLPLFITLEAALVAGVDHAENQWKNLFARPVPRWTWYVAKLLVLVAMTLASTAMLIAGVAAAGLVLPWIQPQLHFAFPIPWAPLLGRTMQVTGLVFLALTIQHWVSLRWKSFPVATGVGIVATVAGYLMVVGSRQGSGWIEYFPWALPMIAIGPAPHNIPALLWISGAAGLVVTALGCADFCRREVK